MANPEDYPAYPDANIGAENLLLNREAEANRIGVDPGYTPPSRNGHYRALYPWDEQKHAIVYARSGDPLSLWAGQTGLQTLLEGQLPSGLIPNQLNIRDKRRFDLEILVGFGSSNHCNYGQPPLGAMAAVEMHRAISAQQSQDPSIAMFQAKEFLDSTYEGFASECLYWAVERRNGPHDSLIGNIRPEETGRDEGPDMDSLYERLDFIPFRQLPRKGPETPLHINLANSVITYASRMTLASKMRKTGGSIEEAREILWFNDVEFNCLVAVDCYHMAELARCSGRDEEAEKFSILGQDIERQILQEWQPDTSAGQGMWFPEARDGLGMFYGLDSDGQPLKDTATVSNLAVLLLPNLREEQITSTLSLLEQKFMARYGLATVAMDSSNYDPHYGEKASKWHGPSWLDQAYLVAEGLLLHINRRGEDLAHRPDLIQRSREALWHLSSTATEVLDMWAERGIPIPEFYNPETAKAHRLSVVKHFGWSNMGRIMPRSTAPSVMTETLLRQLRPKAGEKREKLAIG